MSQKQCQEVLPISPAGTQVPALREPSGACPWVHVTHTHAHTIALTLLYTTFTNWHIHIHSHTLTYKTTHTHFHTRKFIPHFQPPPYTHVDSHADTHKHILSLTHITHARTHSSLLPSLPDVKYERGVLRTKGADYLDISTWPHVLLAPRTSEPWLKQALPCSSLPLGTCESVAPNDLFPSRPSNGEMRATGLASAAEDGF